MLLLVCCKEDDWFFVSTTFFSFCMVAEILISIPAAILLARLDMIAFPWGAEIEAEGETDAWLQTEEDEITF